MTALLIEDSNLPAIVSNGVAVVPLKGEIAEYTTMDVKDMLDDALRDDSIKAIVLDIDSPGGGVLPSKELMYKVKEDKDKK